MSMLEATGINVRFGGHAAVIDVDLSVQGGTVTGLIGPNGAGKTTMFNVLTGLQAPVSGRVMLDSLDVTGDSTHERARRGLARTFQRLELFGSLTVEENLLVAAEAHRRIDGSSLNAAGRVDAVAHRVGVADLLGRRADHLSTGQARMVELARALVGQPKVLLLDEPASGLDAAETEVFGALLGEIVGDGLAVLIVEHDVPLVMKVCSRLFVMDLGRVIASGAPDVVRNDEKVIAAYLGRPEQDVA
jgi:branched-chain amino acid transport system ATP-binding protein